MKGSVQVMSNIYSVSGAEIDHINRGVSALAHGAIDAILECQPGASILLLDYYKKQTTLTREINNKDVKITRSCIRFSWKLANRNNIVLLILGAVVYRILPIRILRNFIEDMLPVIGSIKKVKTAFSIAGGDSFSDIYGIRRFFYTVLIQILIITLKKPLVHLPQTIGPYKYKISHFIAGFVMMNSKVVFTRDTDSQKFADQIISRWKKADSKVIFCYDVGFLLKSKKSEKIEQVIKKFSDKSILVGLNVSGLLKNGGYNGKNQFGLNVDYFNLCKKIIGMFLQKTDVKIILVPHVYGISVENDLDACKKIMTEMEEKNRILLFDEQIDAREVKYLISLTDFFIGTRMHSCIASISQTIPTVSLAYSKKYSGVMKSIGIENSIVDLRAETEAQIIEKIMEQFDKRNDTRKYLASKIPEVLKSIYEILAKGIDINP